MDCDGRRQAAHAARLDVEILRAFKLEGQVGDLGARDALVQADRRADRLLEHRMADEVLRREGLFDHRQVEVVQAAERLHVVQAHRPLDVDVNRAVGNSKRMWFTIGMSHPGRNFSSIRE